MRKSKILKIEKIFLSIVLFLCLAGGAVFGFITAEIKNYSGIDNLKKFQPSIPSRLYDVNGELIAELFQQKRDLVSFEQLPACLVNSFLAAEDRDFFEHFGINPLAVMRAMFKNIVASVSNMRFMVVQGGSTITQQLAKRLFTGSEKTFARKAFEAVLALQIEKKFSKKEILEMYFNQIYLGHGCHGISTAARFFFDKNVEDLSVIESSVLAALPSKPNGFSPIKFPRESSEKNLDTLKRIVDADFLSKERADQLYREFWPVFFESIKTEFPTKNALSKNVDKAPYFTDYVRQILISRFGEDVVYNDGLSIYTTLDLKRQLTGQKYLTDGLIQQNEKSKKALERYNSVLDRDLINSYNDLRLIFNLSEIELKNDIDIQFKKKVADTMLDTADILTLFVGAKRVNSFFRDFRKQSSVFSTSMDVEGALIAIEPATGYISTMIGGRNFNVSNQYNRAIQARRQPGSAFKPFVYGAAIEAKVINPATALPDAPIANINAEGDAWTPGNYGGSYSGLVTVRRALASSINIISVRIYDLVGPDRIIDYAAKILKVPETRFHPNPSLALGTTEVTPFEIATAYAVYANRGRAVVPFAIRHVVDRDGRGLLNIEEEVGNILAFKEMDGTIQVVPEEVAYVMRSLMEGVIDRGTAHEAVRVVGEFKKKAAGKTGTTSNWTDAWFCGFTSDISTVVWVGYDHPFMSLGKHQSGSSVAGPIWANYMREIYNGMPDPVYPKQPPGVYHCEVCKYTGLLPSETCEEVINEIMIAGSAPKEVCDGKHKKMKSVLDRYMEKEGLSDEE